MYWYRKRQLRYVILIDHRQISKRITLRGITCNVWNSMQRKRSIVTSISHKNDELDPEMIQKSVQENINRNGKCLCHKKKQQKALKKGQGHDRNIRIHPLWSKNITNKSEGVITATVITYLHKKLFPMLQFSRWRCWMSARVITTNTKWRSHKLSSWVSLFNRSCLKLKIVCS